VPLEVGFVVECGRVLMRDQWNSALPSPLKEKHQPQVIWIDKIDCQGPGGEDGGQVLTSHRIRTLPFAGTNTDQCVRGSLQGAVTKGWDCLLPSDGCATTSPNVAQQGL